MIFTDIEDLRKYVSVNQSFNIEDAESDFDDAFDKVVAFVSDAQWTTSQTSNDAKDVKLVKLVKKAVANLGLAAYFPIAKLQLDSGGAKYGHEKVFAASAEDKNDYLLALYERGYDAIDNLLQHLEKNKSYFTAWKNSTAFTEYNDLLVRNADEFDLIGGRRSVFVRLIPYIKAVTVDTIEVIVPSSIVNSILTKRKAGTALNATEQKLMDNYLTKIVQYFSLERALSGFSVSFVRDTVAAYEDVTANQPKSYKELSLQKMNNYRQTLIDSANKLIPLMQAFITANAGDLGYTLPTELESTRFAIPNDAANKMFWV